MVDSSKQKELKELLKQALAEASTVEEKKEILRFAKSIADAQKATSEKKKD